MMCLRVALCFILPAVLCTSFFNQTEVLFKQWMKEHNKQYGDAEEYNYRLKIFLDSMMKVEQHNVGQHTYTLGLTQFSDLTFEEFSAQYLINAPQHCSATKKGSYRSTGGEIPRAVDWRKKGVVSPVKDQGKCGSCWTFSTTGAMEAHTAIKYNDHLILSEQQLIDCAQDFDNHGCAGGLPSHAFEYIHYNPGLMTEDDYPYTAKEKRCKFEKSKAKAFVADIVNITQGNEDELRDAVANAGPVSIAYQVVDDFRLYKSGIYMSDKCKDGPMDVNHAVLVVGYDEKIGNEGRSIPYWIVKNSWGEKFGMDGYFWMIAGRNMCGMAVCNSYPLVSDKP
ncbi:unnamed protein product [Owenia fusiformis]|uniref:Uncharacterized protein n=1 Tax=Owenia fusiformis TaxID=6347 RepID=A0A8S4PQE2_OWEFU|nr:unnamed protein product [Owenia fusiformis]